MENTNLEKVQASFFKSIPHLFLSATQKAPAFKFGETLLGILSLLGELDTKNGIVTLHLHNGEVWDFTVPMKK